MMSTKTSDGAARDVDDGPRSFDPGEDLVEPGDGERQAPHDRLVPHVPPKRDDDAVVPVATANAVVPVSTTSAPSTSARGLTHMSTRHQRPAQRDQSGR
jgi:hypothetical protein